MAHRSTDGIHIRTAVESGCGRAFLAETGTSVDRRAALDTHSLLSPVNERVALVYWRADASVDLRPEAIPEWSGVAM